MTRIDFHTNIIDKSSYACRLARKAYASGAKLVLLVDGPAEARQLSAGLWTLSDTDFLPNVLAGDPLEQRTPIVVWNASEARDPPHFDMLVNLTRQVPAGVDRYQRVFEIISTDDEDAAAGRKRYVDYKKQSFPLTHFVAGQA